MATSVRAGAFTLTLVTPEKKLIAGQEVSEVFVPAYRGELNVLSGHAPLMTTLSTGVLKYRAVGQDRFQYIAISWGYAQVNAGGVNVLAETAERPSELDVARIDRAMKEAEENLHRTGLTPEEIKKFQTKLDRARVRKQVASHARADEAGT